MTDARRTSNILFLLSVGAVACAAGDDPPHDNPGLGTTGAATGDDLITTIGESLSAGDGPASASDDATSPDTGGTGTGTTDAADTGGDTTQDSTGASETDTSSTDASGGETGGQVSGCEAYAEHQVDCGALTEDMVDAYVLGCNDDVQDYYDIGGQECGVAYEDALACLAALDCRAIGCDDAFGAIDEACGFV